MHLYQAIAQKVNEWGKAGYPQEDYPVLAEILEWASNPDSSGFRLRKPEINALIDRRGRENYAGAANHLKVVRGLYKRLGRQADWQALVTSLRQDKRMLRAFQDELNKAGL